MQESDPSVDAGENAPETRNTDAGTGSVSVQEGW